MPLDFSQFADSVVLTIQKALIPVFERLSAAEQFQKDVKADIVTLTDIRDRLVMIETKAATLQMPVPVDLAPVLVRQAELGIVLESLKAQLTAADVADSQAREEFSGLRERLTQLESRPPVVGPPGPTGPAGPAGLDGKSADLETVAQMRERLAVLETRPAVVGPPGPAGTDGKDGEMGKPGLSYEGVYQEGKQYDVGQLVTFAGSTWHCNTPTSAKPGEGSKDYTLMVKRGRDGKDVSEPRMGPLPVVHR